MEMVLVQSNVGGDGAPMETTSAAQLWFLVVHRGIEPSPEDVENFLR